jgi:hypothetical protein
VTPAELRHAQTEAGQVRRRLEQAPAREVLDRHVTEGMLQRQVLQLARLRGWLAYHPLDSRGSEPGFPDLVLVRERVVFAELKSATGRLSQAQRTWLDRLTAAGAECYCWRPSDWDQITEVLT